MIETGLNTCHPQWQPILKEALACVSPEYLKALQHDTQWLPGQEKMFAAFSLPLEKTRYILLGESPYPRVESANGYAFWDNAVTHLWSAKGLSKEVNRATSLRNFLKMLLVARKDLAPHDTKQECIALVNKSALVQTAEALFNNMMAKGILLLNASLVYSPNKVPYHAKQWQPFMTSVFMQLVTLKSNIQFILLGNIAKQISVDGLSVGLMAEHPYNLSFITNECVINFFNPLDLLHDEHNR